MTKHLILPILVLCVVSMVVVGATAQQAPVFGRIEGKVIDARCGTALAYANVFVVGTAIGAMSGADGVFAIDSIPPGTYTLRVHMMFCDTRDVAGVTVEGGATVQQEVGLQRMGRSNRVIDAAGGPATCGVHGVEMLNVVVPVGYGLPVIDRKYEAVREARFPHAEPRYDGGCVVSSESPRRARIHMCPQCVAECNRYRGVEVWDRAVTGGRDLRTHRFADAVEFSVPPNAGTENVNEPCKQASTLTTDSVTVQIVKVDWLFVADEYPRKFEHEARVIQAGVGGTIGVVESGDRMDVYVKFLATPIDGDAVIMRIQVRGREGLSLAAAIVRSVRFLNGSD